MPRKANIELYKKILVVKSKGLSNREVAKLMNVSHTTVMRVWKKSGNLSTPRLDR